MVAYKTKEGTAIGHLVFRYLDQWITDRFKQLRESYITTMIKRLFEMFVGGFEFEALADGVYVLTGGIVHAWLIMYQSKCGKHSI